MDNDLVLLKKLTEDLVGYTSISLQKMIDTQVLLNSARDCLIKMNTNEMMTTNSSLLKEANLSLKESNAEVVSLKRESIIALEKSVAEITQLKQLAIDVLEQTDLEIANLKQQAHDTLIRTNREIADLKLRLNI